MSRCARRGLFSLGAVLAVMALLVADARGQAGSFSEDWESYNNGTSPYGAWKIEKGTWAEISDDGRNGGKCLSIAANVKTRLRHDVNLSKCRDIVLQGWLYDTGGDINRSSIGLTDENGMMNNPLIRIGIGAPNHRTYTIVFYDPLQTNGAIIIDTQLPFEKGWHFMRLDIMHDHTVTYRVWNASQTIEKTGNFAWVFDKKRLIYLSVGALMATPELVRWDDIKVGSLKDIGPPPALPHPPAKPTTPAKPEEQGLQLWLQFEDEGVVSVKDSSPENLPVMLRNGAVITNMVGRGRCLDLDGKEAHIELPPGFADFSHGMTVAFWARRTEERKWGRFIDFANGEKMDNIVFARQLTNANLALVVYRGENSGRAGRVVATNVLELLQWQHLAATMDSAGHVKLYRDGSIMAEGDCLLPEVIKRTRNFIGKSNFADDDTYAGQIDDVRIYDRALSDNEIATIARPSVESAAVDGKVEGK